MWKYTSRIRKLVKPNFEMFSLSKIDEVSTDYNACNEMTFLRDHLP